MWMLSVVVADVLPGVMLDCPKVAVAPGGRPLAANVTAGMVAPFCAVTVRVNCAELPGAMEIAGMADAITKSGMLVPLPAMLAVCGDAGSLSATRMFPVALPVVTGEKVTEMVQLAPAASVAPQKWCLRWR